MRVAVVGVGHLGQHHARVLAALPDVELVGVADARIEQARAVAERHGTEAFADYRDLIDRVDAVSIAVPTALHRAVAGAFLSRGIAAMVEKPLASTLAEAEELVELARARGVTLQVGHIERFNPALSALEGLSLRPKYIAAERLATYTFRSTDIGVVLDLMIHDLDLVGSLVATPVRSVAAVGRERLRRPRGHRQRPDRVRGRLRGQPDGQPGELPGRPQDAALGRRGVCVARLRAPRRGR